MKGTILLVEDDEDARASLCRSLERAGYEVLAAADVSQAVAALEGKGGFVHAVVSDVILGDDEIGGLHLMRELRARNLGAPVILITAFAALENVKRALNEGAAFLLEKPFRAAELLEVIARVLAEPAGNMGYVVDRALLALGLTEKEQAVARLLLKGLTSGEIARLEDNAEKTVRQHITRIYAKCGVTSRAEFFHHVFPW
jgi:DNA-binding NarL/FixJ family response regulator